MIGRFERKKKHGHLNTSVYDKTWSQARGNCESGVFKFFKVKVLTKHNNTTCERNSKTFFVSGDCVKWRYFFVGGD